MQALDHLLETRLKDETRACEVTIREGSHQGPIVVTTSFLGRNALPAPSSSHSVNFAAYDIGKRVPLPTYKTATMEK